MVPSAPTSSSATAAPAPASRIFSRRTGKRASWPTRVPARPPPAPGPPDLLRSNGEEAFLANEGPRGLAAEQVRRPDEAGDERGGRAFVDVGRGAALLDPPAPA